MLFYLDGDAFVAQTFLIFRTVLLLLAENPAGPILANQPSGAFIFIVTAFTDFTVRWRWWHSVHANLIGALLIFRALPVVRTDFLTDIHNACKTGNTFIFVITTFIQ